MLQGISDKCRLIDVKFVVNFLKKKSPVFLDMLQHTGGILNENKTFV